VAEGVAAGVAEGVAAGVAFVAEGVAFVAGATVAVFLGIMIMGCVLNIGVVYIIYKDDLKSFFVYYEFVMIKSMIHLFGGIL
jgi:hypothetical protein